MGKRYFCDYCERSFQDTLHNRKKHLNGVQHLRAKKGWYDVFRDAAAILQEEQNKKPCRKFLQTGQCDFGANCRFSHLTEEGLEKLNAQVREERRAKEQQLDQALVPLGNIDEWLEKRAKRVGAAQTDRRGQVPIMPIENKGFTSNPIPPLHIGLQEEAGLERQKWTAIGVIRGRNQGEMVNCWGRPPRKRSEFSIAPMSPPQDKILL
ncbi:zinc finger matrin-type protein 5 isoform X2 [Rhineura floridana]|uniref:zinc finger matrin-type protein 5 isoform X2 n=1 Tax=Rhineura floridana TaxID=261503 RepID=UPI002AC891B3|nr:zinc finger matrin-type protein 5 isoform X2 [Rhineura floridana]